MGIQRAGADCPDPGVPHREGTWGPVCWVPRMEGAGGLDSWGEVLRPKGSHLTGAEVGGAPGPRWGREAGLQQRISRHWELRSLLQYAAGWGCTLGSRFPLHCSLAEEGLRLSWQAVRVTSSEARVMGSAAFSPFSSMQAQYGEQERKVERWI